LAGRWALAAVCPAVVAPQGLPALARRVPLVGFMDLVRLPAAALRRARQSVVVIWQVSVE
jgi:hypothetical protein